MTYGIGIGFPVELTDKDIKKLKRDLAYDTFKIVDGGKKKQDQKVDKLNKEITDKR